MYSGAWGSTFLLGIRGVAEWALLDLSCEDGHGWRISVDTLESVPVAFVLVEASYM